MGIQVTYRKENLERALGSKLVYERLNSEGDFIHYNVTTQDGKWVGCDCSLYKGSEPTGDIWFSNKNVNHDLRYYLNSLNVPYIRG